MYSHRQHKISCVCIVFLYLLLASSYIIRISCLFVVAITATLVLHFRKCKRLINLGVGASCQSRWSQIFFEFPLTFYCLANLENIFYIFHPLVYPKSLYRSRARSHFYGADFGPVGNTEKKNWGRLWPTFEAGFPCFCEQKKCKIFFKNIVTSTLKSCIISLL